MGPYMDLALLLHVSGLRPFSFQGEKNSIFVKSRLPSFPDCAVEARLRRPGRLTRRVLFFFWKDASFDAPVAVNVQVSMETGSDEPARPNRLLDSRLLS